MKGNVMHALIKSAPVSIKAADDESGVIEALVATYAVDSGGDRIVPGAFTKTLDEWAASGQPIPFIWSHMHDDIDAYLGDVVEAKEVDDGLWIKAQIDMGEPKSAKAYRMMKGGRVRNYSFAYDVRDAGPAEDDANVTELRELGLYEVGPTLIGMNRETRTLSVKTDGGDDELDEKEAVSDKPWSDFPNSAFDDEQYARSAILDRGPDAGTAKQRYSLPIREPDGTLNRNAVHSAAAALAGARGGVDATQEQKQAAARKLITAYAALDEDPPEAIVTLAGKSSRAIELKIGRVISAKNEQRLRDAYAAIGDVLAQLDDERTSSREEGKSHAAAPEKLDERGSVKSDEPKSSEPDIDLALSLALAEGLSHGYDNPEG